VQGSLLHEGLKGRVAVDDAHVAVARQDLRAEEGVQEGRVRGRCIQGGSNTDSCAPAHACVEDVVCTCKSARANVGVKGLDECRGVPVSRAQTQQLKLCMLKPLASG